jgi:glutathione S-transferase
LAGRNLTVADLTAAAHLSTIDYFGDVPWYRYPATKDWYMKLKSRPTFRSLLDDLVPGHRRADHYPELDF